MRMRSQKQGFTMIELIIAMFLGMVVLTAGYTVFVGSNRATREQNQDNRMQDNARMAMDVLARNFRRAGFLVNFLSYPTVPPTLINGVSSKLVALNNIVLSKGADGVTIVSAPSTSIGVLQRSAPRGSNTLVFTDITGISVGDVIGVGLTYTGVVANVVPATNTVVLNTTVPTGALNMAYPGVKLEDGVTDSDQEPAPLREVSAVQYSINWGNMSAPTPNCGSATHPVLQHIVANAATCEPIAEDIEDLQIAYGVDRNNNRIIEANEWTNSPTGNEIDLIRLTRITIVARTAQPDPLLVGVAQTIPAIEDQPQRINVRDGYRRFILTRIVKTRNIEAIYSL
jgi:prepilin-type N-terminal cleavage/methylation domain-containing protein